MLVERERLVGHVQDQHEAGAVRDAELRLGVHDYGLRCYPTRPVCGVEWSEGGGMLRVKTATASMVLTAGPGV